MACEYCEADYELARRIKRLVLDLNSAIQEGADKGLEVSIDHVNALDCSQPNRDPVPLIKVEVSRVI